MRPHPHTFNPPYRAVVVILAIGLAVVPALAFAIDWRGRVVNQTNYGSGATIGTSNPSVGTSYSFEFIMSRITSPEQRFIQTGWIKKSSCGSSPRLFVENYKDTGGYNNQCLMQYAPSGDNDYYQEYDGNTGYWCHGYNGICVQSKLASTVVGFSTGTTLAAYGEANTRAAQMGGPSESLAVWITNVKYKPTSTASQWNYIQSTGSDNGTCPATCPYDYRYGLAATVLYTYNWTK